MKQFEVRQRWRFIEVGVVVALAIGVDIVAREAPTAIHPVVWMGRLINLERKAFPAHGRVRQLVAGGALVAANLCLSSVAGTCVQRGLDRLPLVPRLGAQAAVLSTLMSLRMLGDEALRVARLVDNDDISGARVALRSLVSRDTTDLDSPLVLAAVTESVAENASDAVIAPLLSYAIFGLPGAAAYRMGNTMDSMIGYHGAYEHLGKAAARLDDLLNLVPARATAALLALGCALTGGNMRRAWQIGWRDRRLTESPNAGWPMSVVAGALGVRLEKRGHYILGSELPVPSVESVHRAVRLLYVASGVFAALVLGCGIVTRFIFGKKRM